jgi:type II secretory pathway pseudopilin PulG
MAALSTLALIGVGAAVVGTGYSIAAGERANDAQTQARRRQQRAQDEALRQQMIQRQRSVQDELRQNRPTPASTIDPLDQILSPDRTGGVADRLRLQRRTLLGGGS